MMWCFGGDRTSPLPRDFDRPVDRVSLRPQQFSRYARNRAARGRRSWERDLLLLIVAGVVVHLIFRAVAK